MHGVRVLKPLMAKLFAAMSRRGNPYDNALAENFFSILKTECIHRAKLKSYEEDSLLITEYINFYNNYRIQTKTKLTPFEKTESVCYLTINFLHHPGPFCTVCTIWVSSLSRQGIFY